ncbi:MULTISPECIES: hypothetical protein [unclassified Mucilaginibacter]|uniref:hypothetical protein n=1 Tax=unclassified Mucilaginibacter TaxID=2617802 RepID=UPI0031F608EB
MKPDKSQTEESAKREAELESEVPATERDEVKKAESRTQELQKDAQDTAGTKKDTK